MLFQDLTRFFLIMLENGRWLSIPLVVSAWGTLSETFVILRLRREGLNAVRNVAKPDGLPTVAMLLLGCDQNARECKARGPGAELR
jgi:hypothetical protein